jgi:hypothetical protein
VFPSPQRRPDDLERPDDDPLARQLGLLHGHLCQRRSIPIASLLADTEGTAGIRIFPF